MKYQSLHTILKYRFNIPNLIFTYKVLENIGTDGFFFLSQPEWKISVLNSYNFCYDELFRVKFIQSSIFQYLRF
jgi:hypothetical protein